MLRASRPPAPVKFHTLRRTQQIPRPVDEVFAFFADARNLEALTPPWLGFCTLTPGQIQLAAGAEMRYRLHVHGIPVGWTTQIRHWSPPARFVDVQLRGPYSLWHHTHRFEACNGGTRMSDVVRYRVPLGPIGRLVNALVVRHDVERIFAYRNRRIGEIFG
jgi:ligand-binding SRPBCC domain-containing protein